MSDHNSAVAYASHPGLQAVPWQNRRWRGAFTSTAKSPSTGLGCELAPGKIATKRELEVLRDRRNRLWNIAHPFDQLKRLTVKLNRPSGVKRLTYHLKPSTGRRHWDTASAMLQRGINTPTAVAFYERHRRSGVRDSY